MNMKTFNLPLLTAALFIVLVAATLQSCYRNFYKVSDKPAATPDYARSNEDQSGKYFILRSGNRAFHMQNLAINHDNNSLTCTLAMVDVSHTNYLLTDKKKGIPYLHSKGESVVMDEVHMYIPADDSLQYDQNYVLDIKKIIKIETLEKDRKRTTMSTVLSTGGVLLTLAVVAGLVFAIGMEM